MLDEASSSPDGPAGPDPVCLAFDPVGRRGHFPTGTTVLDAARALGVGLAAVCGGKGTCGRCKVKARGKATPPTQSELDHLEARGIAEGYRLGCQVAALGDLNVSIPSESLSVAQRVQVEGVVPAVATLDPVVVAHDLQLPPASLSDLRSDWTRLAAALDSETPGHLHADSAVLQTLPMLIRHQNWELRVGQRGNEVVGLLPSGAAILGLAVDVGTTTIAGYLMNLDSGEVVARKGVMNPQIAYGEDVMSRISQAGKGLAATTQLQKAVTGTIAALIGELTGEVAASADQVVEIVVVGNPAMHHLFLGLPVEQLGTAPYVSAINEALDVKARDLGLVAAPGAYVHLLPNVAGFVGADHIAMLLATKLPEATGTAIALDIGTNTEISLVHNGALFCCSCASGPAFEGAHLRDGMRAASGAIERVWVSGDQVLVQTVGDAPAVGICGSGVLDAIAQLVLASHLNPKGRFSDPNRRRSDKDGAVYVLVPAERSGTGRDVVLTQRDVNEIQLAKGAIRAGIERLLIEAGTDAGSLDSLIVAGAFGTYVDLESAMAIGMFPSVPLSRCHQMGNAAGAGARLALLSRAEREAAQRIAGRLKYVELSGDERFSELFIQHLKLAP